MKVERFVLEYANYVKNSAIYNELMQSKYKDEIIQRVDHAIRMREKGFITANEAIKLVGNF